MELTELLEALLEKYNQADFVIMGLEMVADLAHFQSQFGLRSFKEQPVLPFPLWLTRKKLHDSILWKKMVFARLMAHVVEAVKNHSINFKDCGNY